MRRGRIGDLRLPFALNELTTFPMVIASLLLFTLLLSPVSAAGQRDVEEPAADGRIMAFVSVLPQTYFVERIGGDRVAVRALVPPGRGPATYEPTPRQVTALGRADVYFSVGVPFEASLVPRIRENLPDLLLVDTARDVEKRYLDDHGHEEPDHVDEEPDHSDAEEDPGHNGAPDPHVWLGPEEVLEQIAVIRDTLVALDPAGETGYRENHDRFAQEIRDLHAELSEELAPFRGKTFFVYHPSFGYFADAYGLEQVAIETGGDEPTPAQLRRIIRNAREMGVHVVFVQPQFSQNAARRVAEAIDGSVVAVDHLDPDWFETMRRIARALQEGL